MDYSSLIGSIGQGSGILGGIGDLASGISGIASRTAGEQIQSSMYDIFDPLEHDIFKVLQQQMRLQGKRDPETGEITKPAYLPPALQYAVNSMKRMTDIEAVGGLDALTRTGIEGLDQIAETLAGRGDITGGQRYQMTQGLRDRILDAMLRTRREAASAAAGYEADVWNQFANAGLDTARFAASGFQVSPIPSTAPSAITSIGAGAESIAGSLAELLNSPSTNVNLGFDLGKSLDSGKNYNIPGIIPPDDPFWQLR